MNRMDNVVGLDELFDRLFTQTLETVRNRTSEKIYAELDNDKRLDGRTVGICLATIDEVIDDMLEDEGNKIWTI